jgi:hypothetical protein
MKDAGIDKPYLSDWAYPTVGESVKIAKFII